jgi:HNH endonuclease
MPAEDLIERQLEITRFLEANPGIDLSSLEPWRFPCYTYLPGQECTICRGQRADRCLSTPECLFRYRAAFFTRQGGACPWCGGSLPADLGMTRERGVVRADVAIDHIIPLTRGGPDAEWNKQLLHKKCNTSKGNRVTGPALMLASGHGAEVLDFVAASWPPGPMPQDAVVHLLTPLRFCADRVLRTALSGIGGGFRALCGHRFDWDWFPVHGSPPAVTCPRCREHRERLGPGNAPACPASCCAS